MQLPEGTWVAVDQGQPMRAPYRVCFKVGCVADYPASGELIDTLKRDKDLIIRGVDSEGRVIIFTLPLLDFEKAYSGDPG